MCGYHARLPSTLNVLVDYDQTTSAMYRGGYADVWKGKYCDQEVAVKVLRTYSSEELRKVIKVSYWLHPVSIYHALMISRAEVLQGSCDMEIPSTPKRPTVDGCINVRGSVRDDIRVDGEWNHQSIH